MKIDKFYVVYEGIHMARFYKQECWFYDSEVVAERRTVVGPFDTKKEAEEFHERQAHTIGNLFRGIQEVTFTL